MRIIIIIKSKQFVSRGAVVNRMKMGKVIVKYVFFILLAVLSLHVWADEVKLIIKDHRFHPDIIKVASGQKIKLIVENQDAASE